MLKLTFLFFLLIGIVLQVLVIKLFKKIETLDSNIQEIKRELIHLSGNYLDISGGYLEYEVIENGIKYRVTKEDGSNNIVKKVEVR